MKIKEISALTGLTERTIRFYEERSLIQPRTERRNGREYRDYSASDAEQLMVIAGLRRLHFSVEEIREMQKYPGRIARIAEEARRSRRIDAADQQKAASILERADLSGIRDITELAHRLKEASEMLPLPQTDISPDFGRMDSESREEKQRAFEEYEARQKSRYETGKRLVYLTAGIYTVYGLLDLILNFSFGGIISFCVEIGLSIALCCGVRWVRWWLAIGNLLSSFLLLLLAFEAAPEGLPGWFWAFWAVSIAASIITAVLLIWNKSVREFLYQQAN